LYTKSNNKNVFYYNLVIVLLLMQVGSEVKQSPLDLAIIFQTQIYVGDPSINAILYPK